MINAPDCRHRPSPVAAAGASPAAWRARARRRARSKKPLGDSVRTAVSPRSPIGARRFPPSTRRRGRLACCAGSARCRGGSRANSRSARARRVPATVHYEAKRAGLDPQLVLGLIQHESDFRKYAVSSAGARGYMQVMPFWTRLIGGAEPQPLPPAHQPALRLRDPAPLPRSRERRPVPRARPLQRQPRQAAVSECRVCRRQELGISDPAPPRPELSRLLHEAQLALRGSRLGQGHPPKSGCVH